MLSRYANDAHVVQAEFVKSSVETDQCPADGLPEFALVGRSNVGKSSLLNSLVRRKNLALTSKKPGMFMCFVFGDCVYLSIIWCCYWLWYMFGASASVSSSYRSCIILITLMNC